jgi:uncharacterized coiled-coil protein SlyX
MLSELDTLRITIAQQAAEIDHLNHCIGNQENVVLSQKAEIERLKEQIELGKRIVREDMESRGGLLKLIERKSAALRVALDILEGLGGRDTYAITTIKEALA